MLASYGAVSPNSGMTISNVQHQSAATRLTTIVLYEVDPIDWLAETTLVDPGAG